MMRASTPPAFCLDSGWAACSNSTSVPCRDVLPPAESTGVDGNVPPTGSGCVRDRHMPDLPEVVITCCVISPRLNLSSGALTKHVPSVGLSVCQTVSLLFSRPSRAVAVTAGQRGDLAISLLEAAGEPNSPDIFCPAHTLSFMSACPNRLLQYATVGYSCFCVRLNRAPFGSSAWDGLLVSGARCEFVGRSGLACVICFIVTR